MWLINGSHWQTANFLMSALCTLMVRSPEADTMYLSSKSTTFTAARCPTRTRRKLMSVGEAMSQTAIDRSLEHVTIRPLAKRRWRTASLWWISVFSTSPVVTSHTLQGRRGRRRGMEGGTKGRRKRCRQRWVIEWWGGWLREDNKDGIRGKRCETKREITNG